MSVLDKTGWKLSEFSLKQNDMITTLNLPASIRLTREAFLDLVVANPELQLERTSEGELVIMPPTGGETGDRNSEMNFQLRAWNKQTQLGKVFDSSTGFTLLKFYLSSYSKENSSSISLSA